MIAAVMIVITAVAVPTSATPRLINTFGIVCMDFLLETTRTRTTLNTKTCHTSLAIVVDCSHRLAFRTGAAQSELGPKFMRRGRLDSFKDLLLGVAISARRWFVAGDH
jgi:hypothetical protein